MINRKKKKMILLQAKKSLVLTDNSGEFLKYFIPFANILSIRCNIMTVFTLKN